jgi:hypothetical protein
MNTRIGDLVRECVNGTPKYPARVHPGVHIVSGIVKGRIVCRNGRRMSSWVRVKG